MKCIHCGKEIENDSRFCIFCGKENQPQTAKPSEQSVQLPESVMDEMPDVVWAQEPRPQMPQPPVRQPVLQPPVMRPPYPPMPPVQPPQKKGGALKWVVVSVWLVLVIAGWAVALLLTLGGRAEKAPAGMVENIGAGGMLTEGSWYQWDPDSDTLYAWSFGEDGTAAYGIPGKNENSTVVYSVDSSGAVVIGYDDGAAVWVYDSVEDCYWYYTTLDGRLCKVRIFRASDYPGGNAACYSYRTDDDVRVNVPVFYEKITSIDTATAEEMLRWYDYYSLFGVCRNTATVTGDEARAVLSSVGLPEMYSVYRVECCHSIEDSRAHVSHYLGGDIMNATSYYEVEPVEYNGNLYGIVAPMGYGGLSVDGELADGGDGVWTLPLVSYEEGDLVGRWTAFFAVEDGTIKLISIENTGSPTLTADEAWALIDRAYFDNILSYFARNGSVDEADVYAIYPFGGYDETRVDCPSVSGVDTQEDMLRLLRQCYTESRARELLQQHQIELVQGNTNREGWFEHNETIYFVPIYARGSQALLREGMTLVQTGESAWTATVAMEFTDDRMDFHIVWENGTYKLDS